jgi:hypothetical protein
MYFLVPNGRLVKDFVERTDVLETIEAGFSAASERGPKIDILMEWEVKTRPKSPSRYAGQLTKHFIIYFSLAQRFYSVLADFIKAIEASSAASLLISFSFQQRGKHPSTPRTLRRGDLYCGCASSSLGIGSKLK